MISRTSESVQKRELRLTFLRLRYENRPLTNKDIKALFQELEEEYVSKIFNLRFEHTKIVR